MRVDMSIPVFGVSLLAAAVAQDVAPVLPVLPVKPVFLTAVALYAMLTRPVWVALPVTVWAGGLTDAMAWTIVWSGAVRPVFELSTLKVLGYALPSGMLAGLAAFVFCGFADRLAGIVKPTKEEHGILWAENNR